MYVDEEDLPLLAPPVVVAKKANRFWPVVTTCLALSTVGLVVVAVNGGLSSPSSSSASSAMSAKKLQMIQEGSLEYDTLSDGEMSTLFDNFKSDFGREVRT